MSSFEWVRGGTRFEIGSDEEGDGPAVLLLPAMSSISTRDEMAPLAEHLSRDFRTMRVDWPGFGTTPAPAVDPTPELMRAFLMHAVGGLKASLQDGGLAVVAAGHAAGYALDLEARQPGSFTHLVLVAPTWRGPLPTMMGGRRPVQERIRRLVQRRGLGQALYALNISRPVLARMTKEHVLDDPARLGREWLRAKMRVAARPNARFASAAFVTGGLDPFDSRVAFLAAAEQVRAPILVIYGSAGPPRSTADMEALAAVPGVQSRKLEHGKLALHEEFPDEVAAAIIPFLGSR